MIHILISCTKTQNPNFAAAKRRQNWGFGFWFGKVQDVSIALCKRVKYRLLCGGAPRHHITKILGVLNSFAHCYKVGWAMPYGSTCRIKIHYRKWAIATNPS
jgi:hypothetical protein